ncbi:MAG: PEP-CTERM sorting domain-containing protein [Planctomycetota bacterium]
MPFNPCRKLIVSMTCGVGLILAGHASAEVLLFDFNDDTPGSPDATTVVYNVVGGAAIAAVGNGNNRLNGGEDAVTAGSPNNSILLNGLALADGTLFSGDLIFQNAVGAVNIGETGGERLATESTPYTFQAAWDGFFFSGNNADSSATFRVTDLIPDETYTVRFFAGVPDNGNAPADEFTTGFSTNGGSQVIVAENNTNTVVTLSATADDQGNLDLIWEKPGTTGAAFLNVIEIEGQIVPEPASLILLGLGGIFLFPRRHRDKSRQFSSIRFTKGLAYPKPQRTRT